LRPARLEKKRRKEKTKTKLEDSRKEKEFGRGASLNKKERDIR
jgi:hypothetical protein